MLKAHDSSTSREKTVINTNPEIEPLKYDDAVLALSIQKILSLTANEYSDLQRKPEVEPSGDNAKVKVRFCDQEIEIDLGKSEDHVSFLQISPDIVKQKWRWEQVNNLHNHNKKNAAKNLFSPFQWALDVDSSVNLHGDGNDRSEEPKSLEGDDGRGKQPYVANFFQNQSHAVWSGWLYMKVAGSTNLLKQFKRLWSVLNIENEELKLLCYSEDSSTCTMTMRQIFVIDPARLARRETASLACGARARVSMAERGSGRRRSAACDSPEEADRLVCCINRLLASLDRRASLCSAAV